MSIGDNQVYYVNVYKRKILKKAKRKMNEDNYKTDSTYIAKTESWPTEILTDASELDAGVQVQDSNDLNNSENELLLRESKNKPEQKKSFLERFFRKIPFFKKVTQI